MHVQQLLRTIPASFEAVGIQPDGSEIRDLVNIKINRLAFDTVTKEGFIEAMTKGEKDLRVIAPFLAGEKDENGTVVRPGAVAFWELYQDEEETVLLPITCENIVGLPFDIVTSLAEAVMAKLFPGPVKAGNSPDGSAQTENTNSEATLDLPETPAVSNDATNLSESAAS